MGSVIKISQTFPVTLLTLYILFFFLIDTDLYASSYPLVTKIDTALLCFSIIGAALFIKKWKLLAITSFITVIILNMLTELSFRIDIKYYYEIYLGIIGLFFTTMVIFSNNK